MNGGSNVYQDNITIGSIYKPVEAKPSPPVTAALHDLAEVTRELALASEDFIGARERLAVARARFEKCRDVVAKETEAIGLP